MIYVWKGGRFEVQSAVTLVSRVVEFHGLLAYVQPSGG